MDDEFKYVIEFYRSDIRQYNEDLTDEQCDEIAAALEARFDECFGDCMLEMQL